MSVKQVIALFLVALMLISPLTTLPVTADIDPDEDNDSDGYDANRDGILSDDEKYTNLEEYYNNTNPNDKDRDGFVIAGGAGVLVLEEMEKAKARGAKIYAEIIGYGATSDGHDMVQPSGEGAVRCMRMSMENIGCEIDYINPHATSTPIGDEKEVEAIRETFGNKIPNISATKSLTGHSLGAAGVQEAIYSILMMQNDFIAKSANIENIDPKFEDLPINRERIDNANIGCLLSNSFGFGGTNASLVFKNPNL